MVITFGIFLSLAGLGIGAYFKYYKLSISNNEINRTVNHINQTRFKALKNPNNDNYGIHIDTIDSKIIGFKNTYTPNHPNNDVLDLEYLNVTELDLLPNIGTTNEILFEKKTGKTQNTGSFTISNGNYSFTFNINSQGVIN